MVSNFIDSLDTSSWMLLLHFLACTITIHTYTCVQASSNFFLLSTYIPSCRARSSGHLVVSSRFWSTFMDGSLSGDTSTGAQGPLKRGPGISSLRAFATFLSPASELKWALLFCDSHQKGGRDWNKNRCGGSFWRWTDSQTKKAVFWVFSLQKKASWACSVCAWNGKYRSDAFWHWWWRKAESDDKSTIALSNTLFKGSLSFFSSCSLLPLYCVKIGQDLNYCSRACSTFCIWIAVLPIALFR